MRTALRLVANRSLGDKPCIIQTIDENEIKIAGEVDGEISNFKFDKVLEEDDSQQELFEQLIQPCLQKEYFQKQDCLLFTLGTRNSGHLTMFGDGESMGIVGNTLNYIFDNIKSDNICSYRTLSKHLGSSLINSDTAPDKSGSVGMAVSVFELCDDIIRDLLADKEIPLKANSNFSKDIKDGKIRPTGLTQSYTSNFNHSIGLVKTALLRRKNVKRSLGHCIIHINIYEIKRFNRLQSTRMTLLSLSPLQGSRGSQDDIDFSELSKFLASLRSNKLQSSSLKTSNLNRLLFSDMMRLKKFNITAVLALDPFGDRIEMFRTLSLIFSKEIAPTSRENSSHHNFSTKKLEAQLEALKLEILGTKDKNLLLESENRELTSSLLTIEQQTRIDVANHYEKLIEEMNRNNISSKFDDDETYQITTDAKLESLAQHYNSKVDKIKRQNAKLKLQVESLKYQNTSMDKLFHVELTKLGDQMREEFERKLAEEIQKTIDERNEQHLLQESNDMLGQKVQLLESQVNILKEKAGRQTEDAEQLYNKIKSLRLDDEVLMLINQKIKSQMGKDSKTKTMKSSSAKRRSGSPLISMLTEGNNFRIYEDTPNDSPRISKKKLSKRKAVDATDNSDVEMV